MLDLEPIKARLAAATAGPWDPQPAKDQYGSYDGLIKCVGVSGRDLPICEMFISRENWFADMRLIADAPTDLAALVAEVERLRRQREVDQDQIRSYARALNWYAEPANWVERIDDRGRDKLSFRWADDDGHMARWALSRWQQNEAEKKD